MLNFHELVETVQKNCHIADANHARNMTMCTYLLEMREFFRWENELPLTQQPPRAEIGEWMIHRESLWESLEQDDFAALPVKGQAYDPFESKAVNDALVPEGLVYGAGIGRYRKPHFFLGELKRKEAREGLTIYITGCEYARDLSTMPAAYQDGAIFLRTDALKRTLWEKIELWGQKKPDGSMKAALECYGFDADAEAALARMTEEQSEAVILHEVGEARADKLLGADWQDMIGSFTHRHAELLARSVRDNLADCLSTLPALLEREAWCSLHFYMAEFDGLRQVLFPRLLAGYGNWRDSGNPHALAHAVKTGQQHWLEQARRLLQFYRDDPRTAQSRIRALLKPNPSPLTL
jgi:hypothetical protein